MAGGRDRLCEPDDLPFEILPAILDIILSLHFLETNRQLAQQVVDHFRAEHLLLEPREEQLFQPIFPLRQPVRACAANQGYRASVPSPSFALPEKYLIPPPIKKGLHGGGFGPHPRGEVKGLSDAIGGLLRHEVTAPRCAEPQPRVRHEKEVVAPYVPQRPANNRKTIASGKPWSRIDQALRVTDLLLQGGGFSAIVLDMGNIAPEHISRVPLATWFRYRAAAERSQASILLLTQYACAKSSAGLVLRLHSGDALQKEKTVFTAIEHRVEVVRERFTPTSTNIISLRKPPQSDRGANWHSRTPWAGRSHRALGLQNHFGSFSS